MQLVILIVLLAVFPESVLAGTYSGGTGETNNPYRIATPNDLNDIGNHPEDWDDCFILVNDINMAGFTYTTALIAPDTSGSAGFQGTAFTGIFDGNDFNIVNLTIDTVGAGNDYLGLFGRIYEPGQVKNLGIADVNITGGDCSERLGGLCGYNHGIISKSYATVFVSGANDSGVVGGLCGENWYGDISNCYAQGSVRADGNSHDIGGLCGLNDEGTIINCYSEASVLVGDDSQYLGGLCGYNGGALIGCSATGTVCGVDNSWYIGGLCGKNYKGLIGNCYATGTVTGDDYLGGLCGDNDASYWSPSTLNNSYAVGLVSGGASSDYIGGLCGRNDGTVINSYFLDPSDGGGPDNGIGTPLTDTQMKQQNSFVGWDFVGETVNGSDDIWTIHQTVDYPKHVWKLVNFIGWYEIDLLDYAFFANYWADTNCGDANDCDGADLDFSDAVDWADLKIFFDHWLAGK